MAHRWHLAIRPFLVIPLVVSSCGVQEIKRRARDHQQPQPTSSATESGEVAGETEEAKEERTTDTLHRSTMTMEPTLADLERSETLDQTGQTTDYVCPIGSFYDPTLNLCGSSKEVFGPFPQAMRLACQKSGGGEACQGNRWSRRFAIATRGTEVCPRGAKRHNSGLCITAQYAFGPFTRTQIKACQKHGGGNSCLSLRWDKTFAISVVAPSKPKKVIFSFPFSRAARQSYTVAPRNFGACRDGCQRRHAASDLIAEIGRPVYAVADGKVLDFYYFYDGTYALVVDHGHFVVRYGEIHRYLPRGIGVGSRVKRGQKIASVGDLVSQSIQMLHFERYSGKGHGPLTVRWQRPYQRRWDLQNPEQDLIRWPYPR